MRVPKSALLILIAAIIVGIALYVHATRPESNPESYKNSSVDPIFKTLNSSLPEGNWSDPIQTSEQTIYGDLSGSEESAQITVDKLFTNDLVDVDLLKNLGYTVDNNLSADGPGSSVRGYKKGYKGKSQLVIISYQAQPTNSDLNRPAQFDCPCKVDLRVFVSDYFKEE